MSLLNLNIVEFLFLTPEASQIWIPVSRQKFKFFKPLQDHPADQILIFFFPCVPFKISHCNFENNDHIGCIECSKEDSQYVASTSLLLCPLFL